VVEVLELLVSALGLAVAVVVVMEGMEAPLLQELSWLSGDMNVTLVQGDSTEQGSFGSLSVKDALGEVLSWVALELPDRDNLPRRSRIQKGIFHATLMQTGHLWSPRDDGRLYRFTDVPGRDLIEIHAATWAGDVSLGWHSDLLGCIAPGKSRGELVPPDVGKPQACILRSRDALTEFMAACKEEDIQVEVV
jgi:Family of unknown function (DUF5675)